jgi:PAT family beta-lactamase induction signal transducer AmpG
VLLLRMTQKRFSATQYALFTSLFALPRLLAGPIAGFSVDAMGWPAFYLSTLAMGIPGLVMLHRFAPFGVREPQFSVEEVAQRTPLGAAGLAWRALVGGVASGAFAVAVTAVLAALKAMRGTPGAGFDLRTALWQVARPVTLTDWVQVAGIIIFALIGGLFVAAVSAARHGAGRTLAAAELAAGD